MPSLTGSTPQVADFGSGLKDFLQHTAQQWYQKYLKNRKYMLQRLTRHLLKAGLPFELWSLFLDPKWMSAQMKVCGISTLQSDFLVLDESVGRTSSTGNHTSDVCKYVRVISKCTEALPRVASNPSTGCLSTFFPESMRRIAGNLFFVFFRTKLWHRRRPLTSYQFSLQSLLHMMRWRRKSIFVYRSPFVHAIIFLLHILRVGDIWLLVWNRKSLC